MKRTLMNTKRRHTIGHGESDDILHLEDANLVIGIDFNTTDINSTDMLVIPWKPLPLVEEAKRPTQNWKRLPA